MSSPIVSTFQPGRVGISIARLVLPQAEGKAPVDVLDLALGRGQLEDQHVLGQPALVAGHRRGDPQREALLAEQGVAAVAGAEGPDLARLGEVDDVLVVGVAGPGHVLLRPRPAASPTECTQGTNSPSAPSTSSAPLPIRVMIRIDGGDVGGVGQLDADVGDRRAERAHREGHDVHRAALHAALEEAARASRASRPGRASCWSGRRPSSLSEQMKVRSSTRATSAGSERAR